MAVLAVLLYHINENVFALGWAGVNLFFVLSGFLITGILVDSKHRPRYFLNFYTRRALRIFPVYYLTLLAVVALSYWRDWGVSDVGYYLYYAQNNVLSLTLWQNEFPELFKHSWSLAAEEQFYLIWPFVVFCCGRKVLWCVVSGLFLGALAVRLGLMAALGDPYLLFITLPTLMDALAAGAFCALAVRTWQLATVQRVARLAFVASAFGFAALVVASQGEGVWATRLLEAWAASPFNAIALTLMALMFAALIVMSLGESRGTLGFLRSRLLRQIGKVSYALYLFHYPAIHLTRQLVYGLNNSLPEWVYTWIVPTAGCALAYAAAVVSWRLVEQPILNLKRHFQ